MYKIKKYTGCYKTEESYILMENPDIKSRASYLILIDFYINSGYLCLSRPRRRMFYKDWIKFRFEFLEKVKQNNGELHCEYCGKLNLIIDATNDNPLVATIDHIVPFALGGHETDPENLAVACFKCNNNKADKISLKPTYLYKNNWR